MKKFLSLLFIFLIGISVSAQTGDKNIQTSPDAQRITVGISVGPTINWMNWKNKSSAPEGYSRPKRNVIVGARYGIDMDIDLTLRKNFYVTTGILIEHTGGNLKFEDNINLLNETINREIERGFRSIYITIPTAVTIRTPSKDNFIFGFNAGFYHSFCLSSKYQSCFNLDPEAVDVDKESINRVSTEWVKDNEVETFKESFFAGIGLEYIIKKHLKAKVYVNYAQSLNNYFSSDAKNSASEVKEHAGIGSFEILLGLSF